MKLLSPVLFVITASVLSLSTQLAAANIVINEIHFDPDDKTEWVEFIEIQNTGNASVNLSGWSVTNAVEFTIPAGTSITAGGYVVIGQRLQDITQKYGVTSSTVKAPFDGRLDNNGETIELQNTEGETVDRVNYGLGFPWPTVGDSVSDQSTGTSYSIQLLNPALDNDLAGSWRSAPPTPGRQNSVLTNNIPPQIRQVEHLPQQPKSNETVLITAKITDPDGVANVQLHYQIVDPGNYIALKDAAYESEWDDVTMHDDGLNGDLIGGDSVYAAQLPTSIQAHRRMIRYRITAADLLNNSLMVPYTDDPQPNFTYFVYDGVPSWTGADRPGQTEAVTYSSELLTSIPVYHLITSKEEAEKCTWHDQYDGNDYPYMGTLVYDGVVYDHIPMRARGGVWRYSMGKNMWKFNMNRGHSFQAHDNYGNPYDTHWDKVNLGANIQQRDYNHRGEQGMFESVGFRLFELAGMESPKTNFVHFRIIDEANEDGLQNAAHPSLTNSGTQYDGDFWGLYLATEQVDGQFLDRNNLPDGNLYKMENGFGEIRNQSPLGVKDASDLSGFISSFRSRATEDWWRANTDLSRYYNYRSIVEAIHHYDIANGKNYYYYLDPMTKQWFHLPWDIDLTWADNMYGQGDDPFKQSSILRNDAINIEYQNRQREIIDLLYNPDQANQLIDEYASFIYNPNGESFVDADRAMWDYHWVMGNQALSQGYKNSTQKSGQGEFYRIAASRDFPGMLKIMKDYVASRGQWITSRLLSNDQDIPNTPVITHQSNSFALDNLRFEVNDFSDPNAGGAFAAIKWRIAEVEPFAQPWVADNLSIPGTNYTLQISDKTEWSYFKGVSEPSNPNYLWLLPGYDASAWSKGMTPIGYGESIITTNLSDMRNNYSTVYLRKTFEITNPEDIGQLQAFVMYDDGFIMWINGHFVLSQNVFSEATSYNATAVSALEDLTFTQHDLPDPSSYLVSGTNIIAVQVLNQSLGSSSDCFFDMALLSLPPSGNTGSGAGNQTPPRGIQRSDRPLKYEIDAVWESEEITSFQDQITIPSNTLVAGRSYRVRAKMKDDTGRWSHWSQPIQFTAAAAPAQLTAAENLRITELMYHPSIDLEFEYIELHNTGTAAAIDISGFSFTNGITFTFPPNTVIPAGGYLILSNALHDAERARFRQNYRLDANTVIYGPYTGNLNNAGEVVELITAGGSNTLIEFEYHDGRGWAHHADGSGHSLVPLSSAIPDEINESLNYGGNWRASAYIGGSPGKADPDPAPGLVINELSANNTFGNDWIEIHNPTANAISLGGWFLSDDNELLRKWALPNFQIRPGQYISFDADNDFNVDGNGFGLSANGEQVILSHLPGTNNRVEDSVAFKAQDEIASWGRNAVHPNDWTNTPLTRDGANQPLNTMVIIDELMYHPDGDNSVGEYIELLNPTSFAIPLYSELGPWRLDGGIEFVFPPNLSLPPQSRMLIVPFDPQNQTNKNAFMALYPDNNRQTLIIGPYTNNLSNQGERIAVEKLMDIDATDGSTDWAIVDEVIYFDRAPWTQEADGMGKALQRISSQGAGSAPQNWKAHQPSPGKEESTETPVNFWMIYE